MANTIRLKKGEDRRIRTGHPWIFSNEVDTATTPLKSFSSGEEVIVQAADGSLLGAAYVNPHSLIVGRLFSRDPHIHLNVDFFKQKISSSLDLRSKLFSQPYYRLVFSEADGLPGLIIDRFADDFVMQVNTAGMEQKKEMIAEALLSLLPSTHTILLRNDSSIRLQEQLELYIKPLYGAPPEEILLQENELRFAVPLWKGQKTGWFYDHRMNRARLRNYARDQTVLDVFSYLGSWGIQAANWGARHVDCIEASAFACEFIVRNAKLNSVAKKVNTICEDAFVAMKNLHQTNKTYDIIILDPPAFVKKNKDRKEGLIAYQRLNESGLKLLNAGGILISSSCSMHVSMEDLTKILMRSAYRSQNQIQILERGHQGADHPIHIAIPETDYLKTIIVRKTA